MHDYECTTAKTSSWMSGNRPVSASNSVRDYAHEHMNTKVLLRGHTQALIWRHTKDLIKRHSHARGTQIPIHMNVRLTDGHTNTMARDPSTMTPQLGADDHEHDDELLEQPESMHTRRETL
jgi:hypothetical protein